MKILYFGTVCNIEAYNSRLSRCKTKPSVAPIVFESALLDGLYQNGAELEIHSFPMYPTFPNARFLYYGGNVETLSCGYTCRLLKTVNLPFLKQFIRKSDARKRIKRFCKENAENGVILTYSIPPFLVKDVIRYARRYSVKTVAVVTDLLRDMYMNEKQSGLMAKLKRRYLAGALRYQGEYDGYVYLTEAMRDVVAQDKPYTVMEGIASLTKESLSPEKAFPRAAMYAGMLHEKYGILNLLDAFEEAALPNTELWLFGDGNAVDSIRARAEKNRAIRYFGTVSREEVLDYEKKATLLVNPRDPSEEFTKYSFPSKTIEYMLSGTPLLTTRLEGIPKEYEPFLFWAEGNTQKQLACGLQKALSYSDSELSLMGERAKQFIIKEKNAKKQSAKVMKLINEVTKWNCESKKNR